MRVCSLCQRCYDDAAVTCADCYYSLTETCYRDCGSISGYRLERMVGSGPKGEIFRARHLESGKTCLIKIVAAKKRGAQAFLKEAKAAASIFHPNIVDIYETGSLPSGESYVVSEDPQSQTLRERLDSSGVPDLLTTIRIMQQAARAVHELHQRGLLHRAIRPENIVCSVDLDGGLLIQIQGIDFGGATEHSIVSNKFLIDTALDSLRYFAPEQCLGEKVGVHSDVYALGVVMYEMLAGRPPFDSPRASGLIEKHRNALPPDVKIDNFELRQLVSHTLMQSLEKRPERRQSSANAFARQLRHVEQLATHVSTPPPAGIMPPKVIKPPRMHVPVDHVDKHLSVGLEHPLTGLADNDSGNEESELMPAIEVGNAASELSLSTLIESVQETSATTIDEPSIQTTADTLPSHTSRLKLWRKRLKSKSTHVAPMPLAMAPAVQNSPSDADRTFVGTAEVAESAIKEEKTLAAAVGTIPTKIVWDQAEDIPTLADVLEEAAKEPVVEARLANQVSIGDERHEIAVNEQAKYPVFQFEKDEITAVTARSRPIRVTWEHPATALRRPPVRPSVSTGPSEVIFFPTILGGRSNNDIGSTIEDDNTDLSFFNRIRAKSLSVVYRSLIVLVTLAGLTALLIIGGSRLKAYFSTGNNDQPIVVETRPLSPALPPVVQPDPATVKKTLAKTAVIDSDNSATQRPRSQAVSNTKSAGSQKVAKAASKSIDAPSKSAAEKKPVTASNRSAGMTRPRIVSMPKP